MRSSGRGRDMPNAPTAPVTADVPLRCIPTTSTHGPLGKCPGIAGSFKPCTATAYIRGMNRLLKNGAVTAYVGTQGGRIPVDCSPIDSHDLDHFHWPAVGLRRPFFPPSGPIASSTPPSARGPRLLPNRWSVVASWMAWPRCPMFHTHSCGQTEWRLVPDRDGDPPAVLRAPCFGGGQAPQRIGAVRDALGIP